MEGLFRKEVVEARKDAWLGAMQVATPLSRRIQAALALGGMLFLAGLGYFGRYTHRETITGQVVPSQGVVSIVSPLPAHVTTVMVQVGTRVRKGDPLIRLSADQATDKLEDGMAYVSAHYSSQIRLLRDEILSAELEYEEKERALKTRAAFLVAQMHQVSRQAELQKKSAESARSLLLRIRPLASKGYVSAVQVQQQEVAAYDSEGQYSALMRQRIDLDAQANQSLSEAQQTAMSRKKATSEVQRKIDELEQLSAQNEMKREVLIRAPVPGTVTAVLVNPGQGAALGQTTLALLPDGSSLQVELLVPSHSVGFMEPGEMVLLRYDAFPYQQFGQQRGRITSVSRTALTAEEAGVLRGATLPSEKQERLFKVVVALPGENLRLIGRTFSLRPGMVVEADVLLETHRLIDWVLLPARGLRARLSKGEQR